MFSFSIWYDVPGIVGVDGPGDVVEVGEAVEAVRALERVEVLHVPLAVARPVREAMLC